MAKSHAQFAGFGSNRRIYWRAELKNQMRRVGGGGRKVGTDVPYEETSGFVVQIRRPPQETRQKGIKRGKRDQAPSIFHEEFAGEIGVASLHARVIFAHSEVPQNVVVVQTPAWALRLCADGPEGLKQFQESDVVAPLALHNGQGIVGDGRVHRKTLFRSGS